MMLTMADADSSQLRGGGDRDGLTKWSICNDGGVLFRGSGGLWWSQMLASGDKVHCTVRRHLVSMFQNILEEGRCYKICNVVKMTNLSSYRTTKHDCKVIFHFQTTMSPTKLPKVDLYGLSPTPFSDVLSDSLNTNYLIGNIGLQNVMFATKILFNPDAQEVVDFKNSILTERNSNGVGFSIYRGDPHVSVDEDFMRLTPRCTIEKLTENKESLDLSISRRLSSWKGVILRSVG